ncbi:MAG: valine--pyruvate transaminase [Spongiibacteraceae bacterium]|nr:valine--pyruvate transaminase [Spongiibacteraceae bacterium]
MKLSAFGEKFSSHSGIVELMEDLGAALNENPEMIFMGGGNPGRLPEVETVFQQRLEALLLNPKERHSLFGIYQSPQGDKDFRVQVADLLRREFGWDLTEKNIAVSNGSQSAFFVLYNMFAGLMPDGSSRVIHLPLAPEYLGYSDIGLTENFFTATRPTIDLLDDHLFKYRVDFSRLSIDEKTAALCVSRPTNPTANVLTDDEIEHLDQIALDHNIPLIIDGAYGLPFPSILFNQAKPHWNENTILVLSLSKLGLPGARTGIIVASEEIVKAYTNVNTITSLACGNLGPSIAKQLFASGDILRLSREVVAPFYKERAQETVNLFRRALGDIPYRIHKPEGAIFLWLWFEGLPISSQQLYQRLKKRGVLIVPGESFFPGITDQWSHKTECIRVSYAQDADVVKRGVEIIADEIIKIYAQ